MLVHIRRIKMAATPMNPSRIMVKPRIGSRVVTKFAGRVLLGLSVIFLTNDFNRAEASVINVANVSQSAVQTAVNSASIGDTVMVPAGTAIWTSALIINNDIQLIGAGQGQTIITNNVSPSVNNGTMLSWETSSNGNCRLSGFTFAGGAVDANHSESSRNLSFGGTCHALRIDHCDFIGLNQDHVLEFFGWIYGVIDHCNFSLVATAMLVHHDAYGGGSYGDGSWADSDRWGTTNALYVESCNFIGESYYSGALDAVDGARVVFRYNYLTNSTIASHGTESTGRSRSMRLFEVYSNAFLSLAYQTSTGQPWEEAIYLRGGTATIFGNQFIGGFKYMIKSSLYRLYPNHFAAWNNISGANVWDSNNPTVFSSGTVTLSTWLNNVATLQDTNQNWTPNQWQGYFLDDITQGLGIPISGNTANTISVGAYNPYGSSFGFNNGDSYQIRKAYAAIDQVGYGQSDLLTGDTPVNTVTGTVAWPHEAADPVYEWGNVWNYPDTQSFPGQKTSADAGYLIAAGVNWLDDVVRPGYTPLVYPHPLTLTAGQLAPPSGLSASPPLQ
jgi:hypothetical protein